MSCPCGLKPEFCHREYAVRVCPAFTGIPSLETHPTREALELQIFGLRRDIAHRNNLLTKAAPILRDSEGNDYLVERIEKAIR